MQKVRLANYCGPSWPELRSMPAFMVLQEHELLHWESPLLAETEVKDPKLFLASWAF